MATVCPVELGGVKGSRFWTGALWGAGSRGKGEGVCRGLLLGV
jgi:hypothetical protein